WTDVGPGQAWRLDAYIPLKAFSELQQHADRSDAAGSDGDTDLVSVLLRVVDGAWPFPPNYQLAPQPLAALDLLEYPDEAAQRVGRRGGSARRHAGRRRARAGR